MRESLKTTFASEFKAETERLSTSRWDTVDHDGPLLPQLGQASCATKKSRMLSLMRTKNQL